MSSDTEVVIRARQLAKAYKLYDSPKDWVKQQLLGSEKNPYYKSFWALKDISFEVQRGKSLGIIGRNGCGKSTLLQIVCGMTRPTKGEIWVKGRVAPVLALGATFDLEATGRENVLIGGAVLGLKRQEILHKFEFDHRLRRHRRLHGPAAEALFGRACACGSPSPSARTSMPRS